MNNEKIKQEVKKYYDERIKQFSDEALALKEKRMRPLYEKILEFAEISRRTTVGIVGSSTGSMPLFIAPRAKKVIGIDLSEESLNFAEGRTKQLGVKSIEYKKGDAESLPLEDNSVDVVLSDCVINLVADKQKAFKEIYRTLRPGGNLVIADPIRKKPLTKISNEPVGGCIAGTVTKEDYEHMLTKAGFDHVEITDVTDLARKVFVGHKEKFDKYGLDYVIIKARKPVKSNIRNIPNIKTGFGDLEDSAETVSGENTGCCFTWNKGSATHQMKGSIRKNDKRIKEKVRKRYGEIAQKNMSCCSSYGSPSCVEDYTKQIGYNEEELSSVPEGANLGLGCGNPVALASLKKGEVVLDLGCGAGFDAFLAAGAVGENGKVIGVDMTPEMVKKAQENATKGNYHNVEFRLGEIEYLPVDDNSVDVIISNCAINLSPDKDKVFKEAYRVLRKGGRLMVSDIVLENPLPDEIKNDIEAYIGCIAGASIEQDYLNSIKKAGFKEVKIVGISNWSLEDNDIIERINTSRTGSMLLKKFKGDTQKVIKLRKSIKSIKVSAIKY